MAKISFRLYHKDGQDAKSANSLKEIWHHIKNHISDSKEYFVEELEDNEYIDCTSANYLFENFKTTESLPLLISSIPLTFTKP